MLVLLALPAATLVTILAPELVAVVLGAQWQGAVVPLQILAVGVLFRLVRAPGTVTLELTPLCTWRDAHGERHAWGSPDVTPVTGGFVFEDAYRVSGPGWQPGGHQYRTFLAVPVATESRTFGIMTIDGLRVGLANTIDVGIIPNALVERIDPQLYRYPIDLALLDRLQLDHPNVRAALAWSLDNDASDWSLAIGAGLCGGRPRLAPLPASSGGTEPRRPKAEKAGQGA